VSICVGLFFLGAFASLREIFLPLSIVAIWGYGASEWGNASEDLPEYVSSIPRGVVVVAADVCWRRS